MLAHSLNWTWDDRTVFSGGIIETNITAGSGKANIIIVFSVIDNSSE